MNPPSATARVDERQEPWAGVLGAALFSALLHGVALKLPLLVPLLVVSPFPLLVVRLRSGLPSAVGSCAFAAALLGILFSPGQSLGYLLLIVPVLLVSEAMARGRGILRGCGWAFGVLVVQVALMLVFANPRMEELALGPLEYFRSPGFLAEMRATTPPDQIESWVERVNVLHHAMQLVYPASFIIMAALVVLANAAMLRGYLVRRDPGWLDGGEFEGVRWPFALAVAFVLAGGAVLSPPLRTGAYNVLLVVAFFFALQGLAVVAFYAHRLAAPPLLRWAVLLLVVVNPWAPQILALIGLFDIWFDFRKWAEPPAPKLV
jgi:predicted membrane protein DUF2232